MALKQVTVIQACNQALGLGCDVIVCLIDGWQDKTVDGSRLVAGKAVAINKVVTTTSKCGCVGISATTEACEVVLVIDDVVFKSNEDTSIVPFPVTADVSSAFPFPCVVDALKAFVVATQVSDDEQNLINILPDGILVPLATIVTKYGTSNEQTALPISATVTIKNPSNYLPMRVIGNSYIWGRFSTIASATARPVTRAISVDTVDQFGIEEVGVIPSATGSAMNSNFTQSENMNVLTNFDDDVTLLDPGEEKTYLVTYDASLVGGDVINAVNCSLNLVGINYNPL